MNQKTHKKTIYLVKAMFSDRQIDKTKNQFKESKLISN